MIDNIEITKYLEKRCPQFPGLVSHTLGIAEDIDSVVGFFNYEPGDSTSYRIMIVYPMGNRIAHGIVDGISGNHMVVSLLNITCKTYPLDVNYSVDPNYIHDKFGVNDHTAIMLSGLVSDIADRVKTKLKETRLFP